MKKLVWFVLMIGALAAGVAGTWYVNPRGVARLLGDYQAPRIEVPAPRSPMTGFKPPQF